VGTAMTTLYRHALTATLALCLLPSSVPADAPPSYGPVQIESGTAYDTPARDAYGMGYASIERATRLDHDAAAAPNERSRETAKRDAARAYEDALVAFEQAIELEPEMYEARTYVGYANRKLGRYEQSLAAYEAALRIKPDYARAIEYQGEAYLALDRFDAAKLNYLRLYALDSEQADKLLIAMRRWLDERQHDPHTSSQQELANAAAWLAARPSTAVSAQANESAPW
jgi:tetratricopeptide (TPR) repeat protein